MRDVARLAGVSIKTVSNILNGYQFVRPETRKRVDDAIRELGYHVNVSARNLSRGRTGAIAWCCRRCALCTSPNLRTPSCERHPGEA
ncbi:LacI family DNA-binding transcriptional regulator [Luedemannella flava]